MVLAHHIETWHDSLSERGDDDLEEHHWQAGSEGKDTTHFEPDLAFWERSQPREGKHHKPLDMWCDWYCAQERDSWENLAPEKQDDVFHSWCHSHLPISTDISTHTWKLCVRDSDQKWLWKNWSWKSQIPVYPCSGSGWEESCCLVDCRSTCFLRLIRGKWIEIMEKTKLWLWVLSLLTPG